MTVKQTYAVLLRLLTIWLVVTNIIALTTITGEGRNFDFTPIFLTELLIFAACVFTWFFPYKIATMLLGLRGIRIETTPSIPDDWFGIGCGLLGIWFVIHALSILIISFTIVIDSKLDAYHYLPSGSLPALLQFFIGLALILGKSGVCRLIKYARNKS